MISVIMPVYNAENYLSKAIESVLAQTYEDFELLLINDGSTDKSGDICKSYQDKDKRVRAFDKQNGGLCSARNAGIERAKGEFIAFMDNDDEYDANFLEVAHKNLTGYGCDVFRCRRTRIQTFDDGSEKTDISGTPDWIKDEPYVCTREQFFADYYEIKKSGALYGIWNGVFKTELFKDIRFDEKIRCGGEDWLVNLQIYERAKSIVFVSDSLYIYKRRVTHSTSAKFNFNRIDAIVWVAEYENKMLKEMLGERAEELLLTCKAVYLVQIIKVLEHPSCTMTKREKLEYINSLKENPAFSVKVKTRLFKKPIMENACMWLYAHKKTKFMYSVIRKILKRRGNT